MPKTNTQQSQKLASLSPDCSVLLTHLIRDDDIQSAKAKLDSILDLKIKGSPTLRGGNVGWYSTSSSSNLFNPITGTMETAGSTRCVCFTESTLYGLGAHRDIFNANYGIAFERSFLLKNGANPCINLRDELLRHHFTDFFDRHRCLYNYIPRELIPFVNVIHDDFDATHEREWRIVGDYEFSWTDIMMIFCPTSDFDEYAIVQTKGLPVLFDLDWIGRV